MLIDAGNPENGQQIVSYIKNLGHTKVDYLVATHPHADHIGGMTDVISTFTIGQMYMPQTSSTDTPTTKTYEGLISAVKSKGIPVHRAKAGVTILMSGNLSANLIAPCGTNYHDLNQYSAVMMLQYGDNKFLFTGDAGATSESEITTDVKADVLKVGHHGSSTATSQAFLNKVKPKYAIIEVGTGNSYGHPTAQTLSRLQSVGATIYRTDKDGTIIFTSDSHTITIDKKASTTKEQASPTTGKVTTGSVAAAVGGSITSKAPSTGNDNTIVYITDTGKKYHTAGCRTLKKSKHAITLKEAKARGYTPCGICHPPE
jgi:competence protein ComEC